MHVHTQSKKCNDTYGGVDLNRNYGYKFGVGSSGSKECASGQDYRGTEAFSEPETRAFRDFLTQRKDEIKFVYNFHCAGKQFIIPFNGQLPNHLAEIRPKIKEIFNEIVQEAKLCATFHRGIGPL